MKVLKIGASWCVDCKVMTPRWEEIEQEYPWLETEYIGLDDNPDAIKKYNMASIPTFIFFDKDGNEILRMSKLVEKDVLIKAILENKDK
ncbi:thioredoxin family protein [Candidatus Parcubacteria bacterium]|jgi:thiol-disulfide isomerase/thioredoxin|nr:thioredoxin family protein [Candidatus Parcubacteria bacterium]